MTSVAKKKLLDLPLKLILTQEGASFFIRQNKKLLKFKLADNIEEYGILLEQFMPPTVQRLLLADYVSKIEISKPEFATARHEVMSLSKLIIYSILYRQYDWYIFKQILQSPAIKKWNRVNPSSIIDEKTHMNEKFLTAMLKKNEQMIAELKQEILEPLYSFINKTQEFDAEEKNTQLFLAEKFLSNLRPFTWFIISKFRNASEFDTIIKTIRSGLVEYMDKTRIAEFSSLMLMELILSAENMNLKNEARRLFPQLHNVEDAVLDPNVRSKIIEALEKNQEMVFVSWKIGGSSGTAIGTQRKLQITVYSKNEHSEVIQNALIDAKNADTTKNSLLDFYRNSMNDGQENSLGLFYISYVNEQCQKLNIRFESSANRFENSDLTVINLTFFF